MIDSTAGCGWEKRMAFGRLRRQPLFCFDPFVTSAPFFVHRQTFGRLNSKEYNRRNHSVMEMGGGGTDYDIDHDSCQVNRQALNFFKNHK